MAFLPLFDRNPRIRIERPWITYGLIALCVLVFLYEISGNTREFQRAVFTYGTIPAVLLGDRQPAAWMLTPWLTVLTSMFLHGSWWHLIGNMLFLRVFGDNTEDAMGHGRFLIFYLLCGVGATLAHAVAQPGSLQPMVGASGAISGVLGAYLLLHPRATIMALVGWLVIPVPAYLMLGIWALFQLFSALGSGGATSGVAWWAHVGGFLLGMALTPLFKRATAPYGGIYGLKHGVRLRRRKPQETHDPGNDEPESPGPWG